MTEKHWKCFVVIYDIACWTTTTCIIFYWIYLFSLDEDLTVMDYKSYESTNSSEPMLSLCFKNPFNKTKLKLTSPEINETSYLEFLNGTSFNKEMWQHDYTNITFDISEYVVKYWLEWRNGTTDVTNKLHNTNLFRSTFSGFWRHRFYKCYGIQMPDDENFQSIAILLKNDVFSAKIRPNVYDFFTLLHYPNQLLRSMRTIRYSWPMRTANTTYEMDFTVSGVEIIKRRNKNTQPCNPDWKIHDEIVQRKHSETVGCRAPYQELGPKIKLCSTKEEMIKAKFALRFDEYGNDPPCKAMESVTYSYREKELLNTKWDGNDNFWISNYIRNPNFKEILQTR